MDMLDAQTLTLSDKRKDLDSALEILSRLAVKGPSWTVRHDASNHLSEAKERIADLEKQIEAEKHIADTKDAMAVAVLAQEAQERTNAAIAAEMEAKKIAKAKQDAAEKVLAWHMSLADKGDAYGQFRMGQRYLTGDGVEKDLIKARDLFAKSAAQGNGDAAAALARLQTANR